MDKIFFHIDVNSAFLSWTACEMLKNGETVDLRLVPSIIGGDIEKRHGIVLAKSESAKAFGITTGEPVTHALQKCPTLVSAPPNHHLYQRKSMQLMNYLKTITPEIEQVSVDECYMDFSSVANQFECPQSAAHFIKDTVKRTMGFTVNIGISDKKVLAKMASDFKKPDRVHTLFTHEIQKKMWPLPVSSLFMCGKSSVEILRKLEILTIGDLAKADLGILSLHMKSHAKTLWEYANGIDDSVVETVPMEIKGVGNSTTMSKDVDNMEDISDILLTLADSVAARLRKGGNKAYMVSTEIKYNTFKKVSHQTTLTSPTHNALEIHRTALMLFEEIWDGTPVRLLGIRTSKLVDDFEPVQMSLFDYKEEKVSNEKLDKLDAALDSIKDRFGKNAVVRGSALKKK